jgi:hypothetical protein
MGVFRQFVRSGYGIYSRLAETFPVDLCMCILLSVKWYARTRPPSAVRELVNMELKEALAKAGQILDEERNSPTVSYKLAVEEVAASYSGEYAVALGSLAILTSDQNLAYIRSQQPRPVQENPRLWTFKSINYNLLCALNAQVASDSRPAFAKALLRRMSQPGCGAAKLASSQPRWNGFVSELPLIAEFCIRNSATTEFLSVLPQVNPSPGEAVLLQHLEDAVALNFTIFSDAEYVQLGHCARILRDAHSLASEQSKGSLLSQSWAGKSVHTATLSRELRQLADGLLEECEKARYLYLKSSLLDGLNIEINQDKEAVQSYLRRLGFAETLARSLDEAERLYHERGSAFDLKASMGHLRSFLEGLHKSAFPLLQLKISGAVPTN